MQRQAFPATALTASHSHQPINLDLRLTVHLHPIDGTLWLWERFSSPNCPFIAIIANEVRHVPGNLLPLQGLTQCVLSLVL